MEHTADSTPQPTALERLHDWWQRLASRVLPARGDSAADRTRSRLVTQLQELFEDCRTQRGSEFSARSRAEKIAAIYRAADPAQRAIILSLITHAFAPDRSELDRAVGAMQSAANDDESSRAEAQLRIALDAPRARFLTQFNLLPDGVKFLVDLRADLLGLLPQEPSLEVLKVELDGLLASWFDPGFLELKRISWQSPALILEKLMEYEAVHPIESWNDLRNRLDTDRRCYAFFHPRMPNEPLIFVEIALLKGVPASVQLLLDQNAPLHNSRTADTAIFYSISNTQRGLRGISFGNLLLKRVIDDLRRDLPQLKVFATLSPLPGFRKWLEQPAADGALPLATAHAAKLAQALGTAASEVTLVAALARPDWASDARLGEALHAPLEKLCARYLLKEKSGGQPLDPVANFHLNNGARVHRLLWLADTSERGMRQSFGMVVSYRYDLDHVDKNHERFLHSGQIAASSRVLGLLG
jgi:malonyl-CoA decarboxylase